MYQKINNPDGSENQSVIKRNADGALIPPDRGNADYQAYLTWLSEGNAPDAAPTPSANDRIREEITILEASVTARRVREAVLGIDNGWLKNLNDQIAALRTKLI